jgi:AraC family transcriptional regulator
MKGYKIYQAQIDAVLHYINTMVQHNWSSEPSNEFNKMLSIDTLSDISAISSRNLHLIFRAYTQESIHQYINRLRLEFALYLLENKALTHVEASEYIGFANVTAFYNAFKKLFNLTPLQIQKRNFTLEKVKPLAKYPFKTFYSIINIIDKPVLFIPFIGNYDTFSEDIFEKESWDILYDYATKHNLLSENTEYWGICYDSPQITSHDKCRFYACMTICTEIKLKLNSRIKNMIISAGQYAVYTHKGSYSLLDSFYNAILNNLPPQYILGEGLILEHYLNSPVDTTEDELLTEVLLPIVRQDK